MSLFNSEREMQEWLEKNLENSEGLRDLIYGVEEIENYTPRNDVEKKIKESYLLCIPPLSLLDVLSTDENISVSKPDILKPDIVAYAIEKESIVLIELKNLSGTTREAGTELSAYAAELKGYLSHLSDGDIINVIISVEWPTLLKHYIFNTIIWQNKSMICLEPCIIDGEKRLKPFSIEKLLQAEIPIKFGEEHLGGCQICLYDNSQYQNPRPETKLHSQLLVIQASMARMAAEGEKSNSHGFAILSRENYGFELAPYMITLVTASPFASIERYFHQKEIKSKDDLPFIGKKIHDIYTYYEPIGFGSSTSKIYSAAKDYLKKVCRPTIENPNNWSYLKKEVYDNRIEPIYFESWGVFKEKAMELLSENYDDSAHELTLNSIELGYEIIDELIDEDYEFIHFPPSNKFY